MKSRTGLWVAALVVLVVVWWSVPRRTIATDYPDPSREVRHVIPWRAGGGTDAAMRGFMGYLEPHLGTRVITENIPGGLSSVGLTVVERAPPDGYTLGTMTYDALTVEVLGLAPVTWRSFEPICTVTEHPSALITPAGRWSDLDAFREAAAAEPRTLTVGNVGLQGIWHQHAAAMEGALGVALRHIPYEGGSGPQLAAILGGEVDAIVSSLPAALPYVDDGELRVLGIMAVERSELVPDAPTFRELGFDVVYGGFRMVVAPSGTPEPVLSTLEGACRATARDPEFVAWASGAAIGAAWRDRAGSTEYLAELAPRVERLVAAMEAG
jgi:tripartite-type tricarboxylate transporter receptor subunit TctC